MEDTFVGAVTVLDAWGTPIYATHPGRPYRPGVDDMIHQDDDGVKAPEDIFTSDV